MDYLIALISSGKGTWGEVANLIKVKKWKKVFIICNNFTYDKFTSDYDYVEKLKINDRDLKNSIKNLSEKFKEIDEMEVALNINSGTGKEHMIVIQSILKAGLSFKFVILEDKKLKILDVYENNLIYDYENLL